MNYIVQLLGKIIFLLISLTFTVMFYILWERKLIGAMQNRYGPNRLGPMGLLQPFADALKLLLKVIIIPNSAHKFLFIFAPIWKLTLALASWAVIPLGENIVLVNLNNGLLYLLTVQTLSFSSIIFAGWAAGSRYALLGSIRAAAQMIAYAVPLGIVIIGVAIRTNSINFKNIVTAQIGGVTNWLGVPLFPLMVIYWLTAIAETNRAPFDVAESESELVAGFHVEYSGMSFALIFLAQYF